MRRPHAGQNLGGSNGRAQPTQSEVVRPHPVQNGLAWVPAAAAAGPAGEPAGVPAAAGPAEGLSPAAAGPSPARDPESDPDPGI
ncbi:MAG: hypothetical protein ABSH29_06930 [Acidimicrobiales bacterium]